MQLILFPFGGNAREAVTVVRAINKKQKTWDLAGFIDDNPDVWGKEFNGCKVLGGRDVLSLYPLAKILAVPGNPQNYFKRDNIIASLGVTVERFVTLVHPSASIACDTNIGYNTLIMAGVVTTAGVTVGNHCVILPNTVISHDSVIKDYCLIGSGVSLSGGVVIEEMCYIGTGTKIIQDVKVGEKTLLGMGTVLLNSTDPESVIVGNPGKLLRKLEKTFYQNVSLKHTTE